MACGTPVIALRRGGALDSVEEGKSGLFFDNVDSASVRSIVLKFSRMTWDYAEIAREAERFSLWQFNESVKKLLAAV
jgi:glycosyltransferase involved in cell wall biosynthesis